MDGFFEDWPSDVATYLDAVGDTLGVDLLTVSVTHDDAHLYVKLTVDSEIDLTEAYDTA